VSGATITRLGGADRYETSTLVSQHFAAPGGTVFVAYGGAFPDALAAASAAGLQKAPLLLVRADLVPSVIQAELLRLMPSKVVVLGGPVAIADSVVNAINALFPAPEAPADREEF